MRNSFRLATVLGIPVEINISWLIILGLVIFTLSRGYFPLEFPNLPDAAYWLMGLVTAVILFMCLLLHELSHSVVAKRNKLSISKITLFVFGGVARMEGEPRSPLVELKMAAAGPAMSLLLSLFFWVLSAFIKYFSLPQPVLIISDYLSFFNFAVAVFNLIPGFPLDGGRILRATIWHFSKNLKTATYVASSFGKGFALTLMALGLLALISGNFISGAWFMFLGFFLLEAAQMSYQQVVLRRSLSGVKVKDVMSRNVITVPAGISAKELMDDFFFQYRHNCFPVVKDDSVIGMVTFHDTKQVHKDLWASKKADEIMVPVGEDMVVRENSAVERALYKLAQNGAGRLLVIEKDKLVGIVSQRDIMKLFQFMREVE